MTKIVSVRFNLDFTYRKILIRNEFQSWRITNLTRILELHAMFNEEYVLILSDGTKLTLNRNYRDRFFNKFGEL